MALSTLPPPDGTSKTVAPFAGGDIGRLYCNESELPDDRTSIQTPTQTSIQTLPFSALGFASCLPESPPDLEALCAARHRPPIHPPGPFQQRLIRRRSPDPVQRVSNRTSDESWINRSDPLDRTWYPSTRGKPDLLRADVLRDVHQPPIIREM